MPRLPSATLPSDPVRSAVLQLHSEMSILPMYYEITATSLVERSGMLRRATSIEQVFPTCNLINAPALSLDRLQIDYVAVGAQRFILISPKDKIGLLYELAQRETGLGVQGDRLTRKR